MEPRPFFQNYCFTLAGNDWERYVNKVALCDNTDPYELELKHFNTDVEKLPPVCREDLVQYFVLTTEFYTLQQLKCHKALEAHNYFTSGWVRFVASKELSCDKLVIIGKVNHSQKLSEDPLRLWILIRKTGEVITGHCECMAGHGSACSHVGAVLFHLEVLTTRRNSVTCTSKDNAWLPPSLSEVPVCEVRKCDFASADRKYKLAKGDCQIKVPKKIVVLQDDWTPDDTEVNNFLSSLESEYKDCGVFRVYPELYKKFVPEKKSIPLPVLLSSLYDEKFGVLGYKDLIIKCEGVFSELSVTDEECESLEKLTRNQSNCSLWTEHRTGRITASIMKRACNSDPDSPSVSLLKSICYPLENEFSSKATEYGKKMEKPALQEYCKSMKKKHQNFKLSNAGLYVKPCLYFMGASPDSISQCDCCGVGLVEVKNTLKENCENVCGLVDGNLDRDHAYFYQVQTQLLLTDLPHCDFVVRRGNGQLTVERIYPCTVKHNDIVSKSTIFFKKAVLPELLSKYFTAQKHLLEAACNNNPRIQRKVCSCKGDPQVPMINCFSSQCKIITYHWNCVGVKKQLKRWICETCKQEKEKLKLAKNNAKRVKLTVTKR